MNMAHSHMGDCIHIRTLEVPMGAEDQNGKKVVLIGMHYNDFAEDCGLVGFVSRDEVVAGAAHCLTCGEHFDAPAPDADMLTWASAVFN